MAVAFQKFEGLGNDFVLVEGEGVDAVSPSLARALCDRRLGVGADGVLVVLPPSSPGSLGRMRVVNADGSVPEMCGNGLRCVALYLARARGVTAGDLVVDTDAGARTCAIDDEAGRGVVTVDMGLVRVEPDDVTLVVDGEGRDYVVANAGNPHAVTVLSSPASRDLVARVGPRIEQHPRFPEGTNVEFASLHAEGAASRVPSRIDLIVWERGVGITQACGTGACATVAAFAKKGLVPIGAPVTVALPGGELSIVVREDGRAIMTGPARFVFEGVFAGEPARDRASGGDG